MNRRQAGDTIVEVLIAIAIISSVLGSSFAVVNRTLANARQAQEHGEALKRVEGQVERLRSGLSNATQAAAIKAAPAQFCFNNTGAVVAAPCAESVTNGIVYNLAIQKVAATGNGYVFTGRATWSGPTGGQEQVEIVYKAFIR